MELSLKVIGHIETPYKTVEECPRNIDPNGPVCSLVIKEEYRAGLMGLEEGQEILILYWFENVNREASQQHSRQSGVLSGTFALRSPHRPNPIAAAVLPIDKIEEGILQVKGLDCLDGTKLLDIKPAMMKESSQP